MDYYAIPAGDLGQNAKLALKCLGDNAEVFYELALEMLRVIEENNRADRNTVMIVPVGPVGQYPIFTRLVNERGLSLRRCWFIHMDEYLGEQDEWIPEEHPLSFRGYMERKVYATIRPELLMPREQRIFPDPQKLDAIPALIEAMGGVDLCIGGIGINGHLAFNEPEPEVPVEEFANRSVRLLTISRETRTINAADGLGGAVEAMPGRCVTLGMKEILSARRIRLGCFRVWHRGVVRQAAYGAVSASFPATLVQQHSDALLYVTQTAAESPW